MQNEQVIAYVINYRIIKFQLIMKSVNLQSVLLLIFILAIVQIKALHLHDASWDYINYLKNQQTDLKNKIEHLQEQIKNNKASVSHQEDIDKKIKLLQANIRNQRLLLSDMGLSLVNEQLSNSQWRCPPLSQDTKKLIIADIGSIKKDINVIDNTLNAVPKKQGDGIKQTLDQTNDMNTINEKLQNAVGSKGNQVASSSLNNIMKTNLNAENWILDDKKIGDLNNQYKQASQKGQLKLCPLNTPFYSNNNCIQCPSQKKFFSLSKSECLSCQNYNSKQHKCLDSEATKTNYGAVPDTIIIPPGKKLQDYQNNDPNAIICRKQTPYYNGQKCISCPKYFNAETKQCKTCQGNYVYSVKDHTCTPLIKIISNVDDGKKQLIIPNAKTYDQVKNQGQDQVKLYGVQKCPSDKPFFNDVQCISCPATLFFSLQTKSCGTCQSQAHFNSQTNHCQQQHFYNNLNDPNWASKQPYDNISKDIQQKKKDPLYSQCPLDKPYSIGTQCISCSGSQHFDYDSKKCSNCYNGLVFSKNFHNCTYQTGNYQTNPQTAPNLIYQGHPKNQWIHIYYKNIQQNQKIADCPSSAPHFDGITCLKCGNDHPYFNLQYKMCQKCQANTNYSSQHHECLTSQGNIASQTPTLQKMAAGIFA